MNQPGAILQGRASQTDRESSEFSGLVCEAQRGSQSERGVTWKEGNRGCFPAAILFVFPEDSSVVWGRL